MGISEQYPFVLCTIRCSSKKDKRIEYQLKLSKEKIFSRKVILHIELILVSPVFILLHRTLNLKSKCINSICRKQKNCIIYRWHSLKFPKGQCRISMCISMVVSGMGILYKKLQIELVAKREGWHKKMSNGNGNYIPKCQEHSDDSYTPKPSTGPKTQGPRSEDPADGINIVDICQTYFNHFLTPFDTVSTCMGRRLIKWTPPPPKSDDWDLSKGNLYMWVCNLYMSLAGKAPKSKIQAVCPAVCLAFGCTHILTSFRTLCILHFMYATFLRVFRWE